MQDLPSFGVVPISIIGEDHPGEPAEVTTASTDDFGGITWVRLNELLVSESDRVEDEMNRDPYCDRFARGY